MLNATRRRRQAQTRFALQLWIVGAAAVSFGAYLGSLIA